MVTIQNKTTSSSSTSQSSTKYVAGKGYVNTGTGQVVSRGITTKVSVSPATPQGLTTEPQTRQQAIADIRAGKYQGISVKGNIIVSSSGERVGVRGGAVYSTKTGEVISPTTATTTETLDAGQPKNALQQAISAPSNPLTQAITARTGVDVTQSNVPLRSAYQTKVATQMQLAKETKFSWWGLGDYAAAKLYQYAPETSRYKQFINQGQTIAEYRAQRPISFAVQSTAKDIASSIPATIFLSPLMLTGPQQTQFNLQYRNLQQQELISKAQKVPYIGTRTLRGDTAVDVFGKRITGTDSTLFSRGVTQSKLTSPTTYSYTGQVRTTMQTSDLISITPPQTYTTTRVTSLAGTGRLLPVQTGITQSFGTMTQLPAVDIQITSSRSSLNLFPRGFQPKTSAFGGKTGQIGDYIISSSGRLRRINIVGPLESGGYYTKVGFSRDASAILRLQTGKTPIESIGGFSSTGTSQISFQSSILKSTPVVTPRISTPISSFSPSSLISTSTLTSVSQITRVTPITIPRTTPITRTTTAQIPKTQPLTGTTTTQIPLVTPSTRILEITTPTTFAIPSVSLTPITATPSIPSFVIPQMPQFPISPIFPIITPSFGGFAGGMTTRRVGAKGKRKYTPSYEALLLNIRGKAPKRVTGAEIRPITKGFSFAFSTPKLRLRL